MSREAMEMALEALESDPISHAGLVSRKQAITSLRQALETEPEALRLADALDELDRQFSRNGLCGDAAAELRRLHEVNQDLLKALHEALETEQEPVAWISDSPTKGNGKQLHWTKSEAWRWSSNITPLYTAPQKKQWVGLTDEQIIGLWQDTREPDGHRIERFAQAIEAKLKEKNT